MPSPDDLHGETKASKGDLDGSIAAGKTFAESRRAYALAAVEAQAKPAATET